MTVFVLWNRWVGGTHNIWTTNLLLSLALLFALVLHTLGRQNFVDAGELLRFGMASLVVVDVPYFSQVLPDGIGPWFLVVAWGVPGAIWVIRVAQGKNPLRAVALVGALFGPILAVRMVTHLTTDDFEELMGVLDYLVKGMFALPLAALLSTASAQPNSPRPVATGRHAG
jgi:hypothetical protein